MHFAMIFPLSGRQVSDHCGCIFQTFYQSTVKMSFYFQGYIAFTSMFETVFY